MSEKALINREIVYNGGANGAPKTVSAETFAALSIKSPTAPNCPDASSKASPASVAASFKFSLARTR